jgi:hypothetical protein
MRWFILILAMLLTGPLLARDDGPPDPFALLADFDRIAEDGGGLAVDAALTQALAKARAYGPLDRDWARVMTVTALLVSEGLARYRRSYALIQEAQELAQGDRDTLEFVMAWRAYLDVWWGHSDHAQEMVDQLIHPLTTYLEPEQIATLKQGLAAPKPTKDSEGFLRVTELTLAASELVNSGDIDGGRQLLQGLRLPDDLARSDGLMVMTNALISLNLGWLNEMLGNPQQAMAHFETSLSDIIAEQHNGWAVRDEFKDATGGISVDHAENLFNMSEVYLDTLIFGNREDLEATLLNLMSQIMAEHSATLPPETQAKWALQQADLAIANGLSDLAEAHIRAALDMGVLDGDDQVSWSAYAETIAGYRALAEGRGLNTDAMANAFIALFEHPDVLPVVRVARAAGLIDVFYSGRELILTNTAATELFIYLDRISRETLQSGETIAALAAYWREPADQSVDAGFEMVMSTVDGGAESACQSFLDIPLCTLIVQE